MIERKTIISDFVIKELKSSDTPLSISQLLNRLASKQLFPNKTTLYRILEKLLQSNYVEAVSLNNGVTYYERVKKHHHHFVCNDCETVYCLDSCLFELQHIDVSSMLPNPGFQVKFHDFNIYGVCSTCTEVSQ